MGSSWGGNLRSKWWYFYRRKGVGVVLLTSAKRTKDVRDW